MDFNWNNEPSQWHADGETLSLTAEPNTDFWRLTRCGFARANGPTYTTAVSGDFDALVGISGDFRNRFDQAGLYAAIDDSHWVKCGLEFEDGRRWKGAVVTNGSSDWSAAELDEASTTFWVRLRRRADWIWIEGGPGPDRLSFMRMASFPSANPVQVGAYAAAPGTRPFSAVLLGLSVSTDVAGDLSDGAI
jgi:regulation of enolase protein 1 (concanavalin A-like superfamily)